MFATRAQGTKLAPIRFTAADTTLSDQMQQCWINFVKAGDPNGPGLPPWPAFRDPTTYLQFDEIGPAKKEGLRP